MVKLEYEAGTYITLIDLAKKYGINPITLRTRMNREGWLEKQRTLQNKVERVVEKEKVSQVQEYLQSSFLRSKKYELLIDKSIDQIGGPIEPGDLDAFTRSELRIHELAKSALRIPSVASVDLKSGGLSIGESIVTAIEKLRANPGSIVPITSKDVDRVLEMEVVDDPPKA